MVVPTQTELTAILTQAVKLAKERVIVDTELDEVVEDEEDQEISGYVLPDSIISSGTE
jgi:hypothetical protein